jgi:hypothetical protein
MKILNFTQKISIYRDISTLNNIGGHKPIDLLELMLKNKVHKNSLGWRFS